MVEGASRQTGNIPAWLERAADFDVVALRGGPTSLVIEAPRLGDVCDDDQMGKDMFAPGLDPDGTALDLVARAQNDIAAGNPESDFIEAGVLDAIYDLRKLLPENEMSAELRRGAKVIKGIPLVTFRRSEVEKAETLKRKLPEPQETIITGKLDGLRHSARRFYLQLPDDREIPGQWHPEFLSPDDLAQFWGRDVTMRGEAHFRPSGSLRLFLARTIKAKAAGGEVFEAMPMVQTEAEFIQQVRRNSKEHAGWLGEVWGQWPGDESPEERAAS